MAIFEPLFEALNNGGIRYVVVGGVAVVLHGHPRMTVDVDLVVDLAEMEARKTVDVLLGMGLQSRAPIDPRDFARRDVREAWIRDRGMTVLSLFDPSNPLLVVDLFADYPVSFEELWAHAVQVKLSKTTVRIASIPDLIRIKRMAGRPKDKDDIEQLQAIEKENVRREKP